MKKGIRCRKNSSCSLTGFEVVKQYGRGLKLRRSVVGRIANGSENQCLEESKFVVVDL